MLNGYALNAAAVNSRTAVGIVSYLPSSTASIEFVAYEYTSTLMAGTTGVAFASTGDITRYAVIGNASAGITLSATGNLQFYRPVFFDASSTGVVMGAVGDISRVVPMAAASTGITLAASGAIVRFMQMQANAGIALDASSTQLTTFAQLGAAAAGLVLDATGAMTTKVIFPASGTGITLAAGGDLTQGVRQYFGPSQAAITLDTSASLSALRRMAGVANITFALEASLSNNALEYDPPERVVWREYENRTVERI
jgi:hypothetical protein